MSAFEQTWVFFISSVTNSLSGEARNVLYERNADDAFNTRVAGSRTRENVSLEATVPEDRKAAAQEAGRELT